MSIFNEYLPKIFEISNRSVQNIDNELQAALGGLNKLADEYIKSRLGSKERALKDKNRVTALQCINEDDSESSKSPETSEKPPTTENSSTESKRRASKKRSKDEVDGMSSPEGDKRQKRNASVKAQTNISKQARQILKLLNNSEVEFISATNLVNVNLVQKLRREDSSDKSRRRRKDEDKENDPLPTVQIKQEKISQPPEPMETAALTIEVPIKEEPSDEVAMPPPKPPVPRPRRGVQKDKAGTDRQADRTGQTGDSSEDDGSRRSHRGRKGTDSEVMPPPNGPVASARPIRAGSRASARAKPDQDTTHNITSTATGNTTSHNATNAGNTTSHNVTNAGNTTSDHTTVNTSADEFVPPPEPRPKRTRAKKKPSESRNTESDKEPSQAPEEAVIASPIEKRPKRTKRGQKAAEKEQAKPEPPQKESESSSSKEERISPEPSSPVLVTSVPVKEKTRAKNDDNSSLDKQDFEEKQPNAKDKKQRDKLQKQKSAEEKIQKTDTEQEKSSNNKNKIQNNGQAEEIQKDSNSKNQIQNGKVEEIQKDSNTKNKLQNGHVQEIQKDSKSKIPKQTKNHKSKKETEQRVSITKKEIITEMAMNETRVIVERMNTTVTIHKMDETVILPNGVYNHVPVTPKNINNNETVVLEKCRETMDLQHNINDATVVLGKAERASIVTDDNSSLLTEDGSATEDKVHTPTKPVPNAQPTSAVKEKVQQFEEMASRTTRTKTRAMAKMEETDTQTPPDKVSKPVLSAEMLNKMNSMIFNGKTQQVSSSASKPKIPQPPLPTKAPQSASTSKLNSLSRFKEAAEESLRKEKEDARKKKEAMLEAKRELQKKKREEKMANAAAAREAAERERKLAMEAAAKERMEKQAHADLGKLERLKEVERKKQELARKVAETEERRRAEELARQQRLAEEQRKADAARKKHLQEAEAIKKEAKEIEMRQREYLEKQKREKMLMPATPRGRPDPVYMADGFEFLYSDEDAEPVPRPIPSWSTSKARKEFLMYQSEISQVHIDKLFSVRVHSPDLRDIFPTIDRNRLKRTSSAVWRTPPVIRE